MRIELTKGLNATIDDEDGPIVRKYTWRAAKQGATTAPYVDGKRIYLSMHRLIMGIFSKNISVIHRDGDVYNNRKSNLVIDASKKGRPKKI